MDAAIDFAARMMLDSRGLIHSDRWDASRLRAEYKRFSRKR
jgi:hypothetical protein